MIVGLGVDICPIDRIRSAIERQGDPFTKRVFTQGEIAHAGEKKVKYERLAARFAAKEAAIKALGGPSGIDWHEMEVENSPSGAPSLLLHGKSKEYADALGATNTLITISHAGGVAVAVVILERNEK